MKIIMAMDIINGKCVRLNQGDYNRMTEYKMEPLEVAKELESKGVMNLHLVDLDGARSNRIINHKVLEQLALRTELQIDFGGGLKSKEDVKIAFESGANQVSLGSLAVQKSDLFMEILNEYGAQKVMLGADCKNRKIASNGWMEKSDYDVVDFIGDYQNSGVKKVVCTDISKDGMLKGPSFDLYEEILSKTQVDLIASGGISSMADIGRVKELGCYGVIIGKAFYEGLINLEELMDYA